MKFNQKLSDTAFVDPLVMRITQAVTLANVAATAGAAWHAGNAILPLTVLAVIGMLGAFWVGLKRNKTQLDMVFLSLALMGQSIVITAALTGHPWQLDSHIVYFVFLGVLAAFRSIPALIAAFFSVAGQHAIFALMIPSLVFPAGTFAEDLVRLAVHATVWTLAIGFLCRMLLLQDRSDAERDAAQLASDAAAARAAEAMAEADANRADAELGARDAARLVSALGAQLRRLSARDLTGRLGDDVPDAFREMAHDYDLAIAQMASVLSEVAQDAQAFHREADASAMTTQSMAQKLETQAAQVSEASNTIDTLAASLDRVSEEIAALSSRTEEASRKADVGGDVVRRAMSTMSEVRESSREISSIIQVIEEISFQTNLLALNAGVEAARAGSAGSGFAVVAAEVRALAHRTSEAANQVKGLVSTSVTQVGEGADLVDQAGSALEDIEAAIKEANVQAGSITSRISDQTVQLREMSGSVRAIDSALQDYAAQTEELSAMASTISQTASNLHGSMEQFAFASDDAVAPPLARAS